MSYSRAWTHRTSCSARLDSTLGTAGACCAAAFQSRLCLSWVIHDRNQSAGGRAMSAMLRKRRSVIEIHQRNVESTILQHGIQLYVCSIISFRGAQFHQDVSTRAAGVGVFTQPGPIAAVSNRSKPIGRIGTANTEAPRTEPYVRLSRIGSHLGCVTAKRSLGQGWRMIGFGSQAPTSCVIRSHVIRSFWLRRRSVRRQRSVIWCRNT